MIISYQWLLEYLPKCLPVDELSRILTSIGLEVEAVEKAEVIKGGLEGLIIGEVLTCAPHPNADKLKVTTVTTGGAEAHHIVCGAPNVAAGQKVVVAPVGATVHPINGEPFLIKKAKIRGEASEGMLCAEDEIGLGEGHDGIMVLPADAPVGTAAKTYFNIGESDYAIHIGLTPNRSDAASHIGVARDVCAYLSHHTGEPVEVKLPASNSSPDSGVSPVGVSIEAPEACPRYIGVSLTGIRVGPSPDWMRQRLATIGLRSINNIVDITNYVLHEWGQPLHAFDAAMIGGKHIIVRHAAAGERFITLDGKERTMRAEDLMICDEQRSLAMAGVFGGLHSGVTAETTEIFLESAYFDPATVRRTSLHHGLRTDAAAHFEKGVDIANLEPAMMRAAQLMIEVAGGRFAGRVVDEYPLVPNTHSFDVSYDYINRLSGKAYLPDTVRHILASLGFLLSGENEAGFRVTVPSSKHDVRQPADVVEEIMRIDGLDEIAIPERLNISLIPTKPTDRALRERIAQDLAGLGFSEMVTNSITNSKYYPDDTTLVRMLNSLSSELDVMRPSMLETGLEVMAYNLARRNMNLALFEHGHVYAVGENGFLQSPKLALFASGEARSAGVKAAAVKADGYFLKSVVQNLLKAAGIRNAALGYDERSVSWKWKNRELCTIMEVPAAKLQAFEIRERVWYALIDWALWTEAMRGGAITYTEVPRFPAVQRDLALVLDKAVTYAQVQRATDKLKLPGLQSYGLFDVFESEKLGTDKKSLALSYTFQLTDRTLTDAETEALMQQLTNAYTRELGAQIRK
jgi:phenylalanyl-tRNA synthetase beta chain